MLTALLPKTTSKMACDLTGNKNAEQILAGLHRENYFTERHAQSPPVYQFHPLFRAFLLARLTRTYSSAATTCS